MNEIIDNLWIGDIQDVQQGDTSRFDAVITVCQDNVRDNVSCPHYNQFKLADGEPEGQNPGECSFEMFEAAVETAIGHVESDRTTLVHCHAGQSRSAMVVAAAITDLKDETPNDAYGRIHDVRQIHPSPEMAEFANQFWEQSHALMWCCEECGDEFESTPKRHDPDYCECGESMVDHESAYIRRAITVEPIEQ